MKKTKKLLALSSMLILVLAAVLTGCMQEGSPNTTSSQMQSGGEQSKETTPPEELDPVELIYYTIWIGPDQDLPEVNDAMNEILKEKINATIKINAIAIGDYDTKMNVTNASGDYYDLAFTAFWMNNYQNNVSKGYLLALDDLLPEYAPEFWNLVPKAFWDSTRIDGKIYGAQNYQIGVDTVGFEWDMKFMDLVEEKTGFKVNPEDYKNLEDLETVFSKIKEANIEKSIAYPISSSVLFSSAPVYWGYDTIGDYGLPGWVKLDDSTLKVINQYETDEYKNYLTLVRKWYNEGFIRNDAAIAKDQDGKYDYWGPKYVFAKPGQDEMLSESRGREIKTTLIREPVVTTNRASATLTGISSDSKNPERALMYLNLMATDELLYNTFVLGIEGKHYVKTGPKTIDYANGYNAQTSPYNPQIGWAFGNQFLEWLKPGIPENVWEETMELNISAKASPILGFSFNPDPIKTEIASCQAVLTEYVASLDTGSVNPDEILPQMLDKLKTAGVDKIIQEKQRQIDEWKANK